MCTGKPHYVDKICLQYDLRASLDVDKEQLAREREDVARDVYSLLIR